MLSGKIVEEFEMEGKLCRIRYPRFEDYPQIHSYLNSLVGENAMIAFDRKAKLDEGLDYTLTLLRKNEKKESVALVLEIDSKIMGLANVDKKPLVGSHIGNFGIGLRKQARGLGLGRRLMETTIEEARKSLRIEIVELQAFSKNKIARGLYKKLGFELIGTIKNGIKKKGRYYDELIMIKYLK